jgi:hypothetical protein
MIIQQPILNVSLSSSITVVIEDQPDAAQLPRIQARSFLTGSLLPMNRKTRCYSSLLYRVSG